MNAMKISVQTIFPDQFDSFLNHPLVRRAIRNEQLTVRIIDIKEYADGSFRHIDDSPYGGGAGMILRCEPVYRCLDEIRTAASHTIAFTPGGTVYSQADAHRLAGTEDLILLCGHYEGFDARIMNAVDEQLSVGDYVLSGGELPAMTVIDSIVRLLEGTLKPESTGEESFEHSLLEHPQYTRPADFRGMKVPEVLLSGHAEKIRIWKRKESLRATRNSRPDLLEKAALTDEDQILMEELIDEEQCNEGNPDHGD